MGAWLRDLRLRLWGSLNPDALTEEMDEEFRFHLERATERNIARGMQPDLARAQALRSFGRIESHRLEAGDEQRSRWFEGVRQDFRMAGRTFRRSPGFAVVTVLLIALGIGANAAIFSVINGVLLKPLPYPEPARLRFLAWDYGNGDNGGALSLYQMLFVREHGRAFEGTTTWKTFESALGDPDEGPMVSGLRVSDDFFKVTGTGVTMGREFSPAEQRPGGADLVMVSDGFWRSHFGADPSVLGRNLRLDGRSYSIIGVIAPGLRIPESAEAIDVVLPLRIDPDPADGGLNYTVLARLRPDSAGAAVEVDLASLTRQFLAERPEQSIRPGAAMRALSFVDVFVGDLRRLLWVLFGAVGFVTLIVCVNAANLMLARASARRNELTVRAALGAGRGRIVRQLLIESLVLALTGGVIGILVGSWGVDALLGLAPRELPRTEEIGLDWRVAAFTAGITLVTGLAIGLTSALTATRGGLLGAATRGGRGNTGDDHRVREGLLVLQTSIAMVLLAGTGLLVTSFARLRAVDPGFDPAGVFTLRTGRLPADYSASGRTWEFERQALERVRALPGVETAATLSSFPLERGLNLPVTIEGRPDQSEGAVEWRGVSPGYFEALRIPMVRGRGLAEQDAPQAPRVGVVNAAFGARYWPGENPVGKRIELGRWHGRWVAPGFEGSIEIVGVAADVREIRLGAPPRRTLYVPRAQWSDLLERPSFVVRAAAGVTIGPSIVDAVRGVDPRIAAPEVGTLPAVLSASLAEQRFQTVLLTLFGAAALLLTAIGLYGVMAFNVARRTREIGVRMVLGAGRGRVLAGVLGRGMSLMTLGTAIGLLGAFAATRLLSGMLYEVRPGDPRTLALAVVVLGLAGLLAGLVPARRATRVDPAEALRTD